MTRLRPTQLPQLRSRAQDRPRDLARERPWRRWAFAACMLPSLFACAAATAAPVAPGSVAAGRGATLVVDGAGDGHGVGMSQEGALGLAEHGFTYRQILAHYYTGTALGMTPARQKVRVLLGNGKVVTIGLERYVRGVVGAEVSPSWPMAALEAQAVASRTYVLTDHAGGARFDVYSDTRSQMYLGKAAETPQTNAAVAATAGLIVTYHAAAAITYFFASSGGLTENIANAFPGAEPQPWLRGVSDPYDQGPLHRWTISMTMSAAARRLRGLFHGRLESIEVLKRGWSPRIVTALVRGSRGSSEVSGGELAARLGLYSTWAHFSVTAQGKTHSEPDRSHYRLPAGAEATATELTGTESAGQPNTPAPASTPEGGAEATAAAIDGGAVSG